MVALRGSVNYLALAVAAGASAAGAWCGVVGMPDFGIAAASGLGADLRRFLMLDDPGEREADAVAVMADACDLILWNPARRLTLAEDRRIRTRIRPAERRRGAALVVLRPDARAEADLRLSTSDPQWTGLGQGSGHLTGRLVTVTASGRGAAGYEPSTRLWLPAGNGAISEAEAEPAKNAGEPPRHLRPA